MITLNGVEQMAADPNIDSILAAIVKLREDDVSEDAGYEAAISQLQSDVRALAAERDSLLMVKKSVIAELIAARDVINARIAALGG
jgi:hypothetical protein